MRTKKGIDPKNIKVILSVVERWSKNNTLKKLKFKS